jgi:hypothetical protein
MDPMYWPPILRAALSGALVALAIDWDAFKNFDSFDDFKAYDWKVAAWRGFKGAVIGAGTTAGWFAL